MRKIIKNIRKHKNFIAWLLAASFLITLPYTAQQVWATSAQEKKEEAEENLENIQSEMEEIESQQQEVEEELNTVRTKLSKLIEQQNRLKTEIDETQVVIEQTQLDLAQAELVAAEQYDAMMLRIKFMYENSSNDNIFAAMLESKSIADFLNRVEYISTIYEADRDLLSEYKDTVALIEEKEEVLLAKMDELLMKEEAFLGQQAEIEDMIVALEGAQEEFAAQLASAQEQAEKYKKTIAEQDEIIKKQQEEEERRRREEEERKKREEEERKKQEQEQQQQSTTAPSVSNGSVSGQDIVNYALQFVGNPYVWGGNSLTNGCDCSGFVHLVYKNFGYNTVRYSMSFLNEGVAVSRENIQPGDIVVYARSGGIGHVAIYAGNGKIVEAQSSKAGITANRSVDCREIIGIRRIIGS